MSTFKRFLGRRTRRVEPPRRQYVDHIALADASEGEYRALTQIPYADALTPTAHSLPRLDPHNADLRQVVTDTVHRLAVAGALDEFTMDVLDKWITAWQKTWTAAVLKHAEDRRETSARLIAVLRESLVRESRELTTLTNRYVLITAQHAALSEALGLQPTPVLDAGALPTIPSGQSSILFGRLGPSTTPHTPSQHHASASADDPDSAEQHDH